MEHSSERRIALVDLDAFFASVEMLEHPELRGKPLLIGGSATGRGVVAAASYEARSFGVHSAMPMAQALRRCPQATILPVRHDLYGEYSLRVMEVLRKATPVVQQVSIDEAYLDLTEVSGGMEEAKAIVWDLQQQVRQEQGLPCSVGLSANKMVAKVACETGKPNGLVVILPGTEAYFLADLAVRELPGIGPRSAERLLAQGFQTLGQVATAPIHQLTALMGPWGAVLQRRAQGEDHSAVHTEQETKSISSEETFPTDIADAEPLQEQLGQMAAGVATSLRHHGMVARTITLKLRFADFTTITRSMSRDNATASVEAVQERALQLLMTNWRPGQAVRLIGVGASNLRQRQIPGQLALKELING
jgi:DNA polymerase-4